MRSLRTSLEAKEVDKVLVRGMKITAKRAQQIVSVRSGKLQRAIKAKKAKQRGAYVASAIAAVDRKPGRGAPHGFLVEAGTKFARAHPFLGPAGEQTQGEVKKEIEDGLRDLLNKAVK